MTKKILVVVTSAPFLGDLATGLWMEELAAPYYIFKDAGYEITLASPKGGPIPIDVNSLKGDFFTESAKKFLHDGDAMDMFSHTKKLEDFIASTDIVDTFDCLYMPGGHGCCTDFVNNPTLTKTIETMYNAGKLVATVCHGPIALAACTKKDGSPLVQGLTVTGFSDAEEDGVQHTNQVPFLIESKFKAQGAKYEKADEDWGPKVCVNGNLVTGQNPTSSDPAAKKVVELLGSS